MAEPAHATPQPLAIGDYGLVADGLTCALIGRDGSVGWLCVPRFDSGSIIATMLDPEKAGCCSFAPRGAAPGRQRYRDETNVLETVWEGPASGRQVRLTDWMPARFDGATAAGFGEGALCRRMEAIGGEAQIELDCAPLPDYGRSSLAWQQASTGVWQASGPPALWATASFPLRAENGRLRASLRLGAGESAWFLLAWGPPPHQSTDVPDRERVEASLNSTAAAWQQWAARAQYEGPYRDAVLRSALVLKALIYAPTGAIVAAPTASLPEAIGGPRNWDYRYCWPRDATFALYGLSLLGYHDEAGRFLEFLAKICDANPPPLQVCYRVDGSTDVAEFELSHLSGYRGSRPVRIGNGAALQHQLDIYGEIMDAAYTYAKWRQGLDLELWNPLRALVDYAAAHWRDPDESIWEVRGGPQQFTYSKLLCWVALDRGIKLAERYHLPGSVSAWIHTRDQIHHTIVSEGYNLSLHAYTQVLQGHALDSSLLLMPLMRFSSPHESRTQATIRRIQRDLGHDSLVARYQNVNADGVGGPEGAFAICTFWLVDCLTLLGRSDESRKMFEHMLGYANPLGLFSEEIDHSTGALLGNYPQAFTHMALLNSAHNLELYPGGVA